ncbi:acVLRF1 family peptidyl-tRNA hydrolase [Nocardioides campestrisoli]|uniref:acVLRF1 family peptidyl-tRNA hydrolase n=1 Tax=Nocardioides campestrisoli TaxID=2736757 RepID=UPI0015E635FD|nr:acVLRF1 family peptidyl-tRNA hydrolase [Nocardioides campestrisoli]
MPVVPVPAERIARWVANFGSRHGEVTLAVSDGCLTGVADDGSAFRAHPPFSGRHDGPAEPEAFAAACDPPGVWGVLLVRKGGFAVARLEGRTLVEHKIGQRHVQGRTKAGGQSQQRFARRRDNQARIAYEAAADHAARILRPGVLVVGGDRAAVTEVLEDRRLAGQQVVGDWLDVPDPRRRVLDDAVERACAARVEVENA